MSLFTSRCRIDVLLRYRANARTRFLGNNAALSRHFPVDCAASVQFSPLVGRHYGSKLSGVHPVLMRSRGATEKKKEQAVFGFAPNLFLARQSSAGHDMNSPAAHKQGIDQSDRGDSCSKAKPNGQPAADRPTGEKGGARRRRASRPAATSKGGAAAGEGGGLKNILIAYAGLSKARLGALVLATTMVGYGAAPGPFDPATFVLCSVGTALTVCSANAMNQWIEVEHDSKMLRTSRRALPLSRISPQHALVFAVGTGVAGTALLATTVSGLCAALACGNILLYAGVYTPLKRQHWSNTWVGAVVGAIPPVIGWAAVTGSVDPGALALGAVLFVWQIPHFLSLAWTYRRDYGRAGYQMFANNHQAASLTSVTFLWSLYHLALAPLCAYTGVTSWWLTVTLFPFTAHLVYQANQFLRDRTVHHSRQLFKSTLVWLPAALLLILFHKRRPEQENFDSKIKNTRSDNNLSKLNRLLKKVKQIFLSTKQKIQI